MKAKKISPNDMKLYVLSFSTSNDLTLGACVLLLLVSLVGFFFLSVGVFLWGFLVALFPVSCFLCFFCLSVGWFGF